MCVCNAAASDCAPGTVLSRLSSFRSSGKAGLGEKKWVRRQMRGTVWVSESDSSSLLLLAAQLLLPEVRRAGEESA